MHTEQFDSDMHDTIDGLQGQEQHEGGVQLTEDDIQQYSDTQKKAHQIRTSIQQTKKQNNRDAHLLALLLQHISSTPILQQIVVLLDLTTPIAQVFWVAAPFFASQLDTLPASSLQPPRLPSALTLRSYIDYLDDLMQLDTRITQHDDPIHYHTYISLLIREHDLEHITSLTDGKQLLDESLAELFATSS